MLLASLVKIDLSSYFIVEGGLIYNNNDVKFSKPVYYENKRY